MKVLKRLSITVPDNADHSPNVVPLPQKTFTATMSCELHDELIKIIKGGEEAE